MSETAGTENTVVLEKLRSLIEINNRINLNFTNPDSLLVSVLESVMAIVKCESGSIILAHREDDILHFEIALGPKSALLKKVKVDKNSIAGWVYKNKKSQIINSVKDDERFNDAVQIKTNYITRNMIAFPMIVEDECLGVIELLNKADDSDFTVSDMGILE
ncbi:MAG: GAF domain-containing protein, partial [Treponema sp.]|nr:GAF domain-containing protein [Treponema sp.]